MIYARQHLLNQRVIFFLFVIVLNSHGFFFEWLFNCWFKLNQIMSQTWSNEVNVFSIAVVIQFGVMVLNRTNLIRLDSLLVNLLILTLKLDNMNTIKLQHLWPIHHCDRFGITRFRWRGINVVNRVPINDNLLIDRHMLMWPKFNLIYMNMAKLLHCNHKQTKTVRKDTICMFNSNKNFFRCNSYINERAQTIKKLDARLNVVVGCDIKIFQCLVTCKYKYMEIWNTTWIKTSIHSFS